MNRRGRPPYPDILTPREWEVLGLLRERLTNEEIAARLDVTHATAKFHVSEIISKLGVSDRHEAAAWQRDRKEALPLRWLAGVAALLPLKRSSFGWPAKVAAGTAVGAAAGGLGLLVWVAMSGSSNAVTKIGCPAATAAGDAAPCAPPAPKTVSALITDGSLTCALKDGGAWCWGDGNNIVPSAVPGLESGVGEITAGPCVLRDGGAWCWDPPSTAYGASASPDLESGVAALASGSALTCALKDGEVLCLNRDAGEGVPSVWKPIDVGGRPGGVSAISVGGDRACAVKEEGGVWCWGNSHDGLFDNTATESPAPVPGLEHGVIAVSTGSGHACALTIDGVWCWGDDSQGQLGTNDTIAGCGSDHPDCSYAALRVTGLTAGVTAVSVGGNDSCALRDGEVWCWGAGRAGQLGNYRTDSAVPIRVTGLPAGVTAITTGGGHACAAKDEDVWCWGSNAAGQLGNNRPLGSDVPVPVSGMSSGVSALLSSAAGRVCALKDERVWCWGDNHYGQLGDGSTTDSPVPVRMAGIVGNVSTISEGDGHSCALVDGAVWCWGKMGLGFLGSDTTADSLVPVPVSGLTEGVSAITVGGNDNCALKRGGVWCWGSGYAGELGTGGTTDSAVPVPVAGMQNGVTAIQAHGATTCALKNDGVWCWGARAGEFAGAKTTESLTPILVPELESGVSALDGNCALKDGAVWWCGGPSWKFDPTGDSTVNRSVAAPVPGLTNEFSNITELGIEYACAIKDAGLWCRIGGTFAEVAGFESGVSAISVGGPMFAPSLCVLKDGGVWCWQGSFFMNIETAAPSLVVMTGLESGVSAINGNCARKDGGVWCWGANDSGQLGNNMSPVSPLPVKVQFPDGGSGAQPQPGDGE